MGYSPHGDVPSDGPQSLLRCASPEASNQQPEQSALIPGDWLLRVLAAGPVEILIPSHITQANASSRVEELFDEPSSIIYETEKDTDALPPLGGPFECVHDLVCAVKQAFDWRKEDALQKRIPSVRTFANGPIRVRASSFIGVPQIDVPAGSSTAAITRLLGGKFGLAPHHTVGSLIPVVFGVLAIHTEIVLGRLANLTCTTDFLTDANVPDGREAAKFCDKFAVHLPGSAIRRALIRELATCKFFPAHFRHTHRMAAATRTSVSAQICCAVEGIGAKPFVVSPTDREKAYDGIRLPFWSQDIRHATKDSILTEQHIIVMVDCDYYTDFPAWLSLGCTIVLYTFSPDGVGGGIPDGAYSIQDDLVTYVVGGGAKYGPHKIWNHGAHDKISALDRMGGLINYSVEYRTIDADRSHRIVFYTPDSSMAAFSWGAINRAPSVEQQRYSVRGRPHGCGREYSRTPINALRTMREVSITNAGKEYSMHEECVHIAYEGDNVAATMTFKAARLAEQTYHSHSKNCTIDTMARCIAQSTDPTLGSARPITHTFAYPGAMICKFFERGFTLEEIPSVGTSSTVGLVTQKRGPAPFDSIALHYGAVSADSARGEDRTYGRRLTYAPSTVEAMFPSRTRPNEDWTIRGRVTSVSNDIVPGPQYFEYAQEFQEYVVGDFKGTGVPLPVEAVIALQTAPTQRASNEAAAPSMHVPESRGFAQSFQKAESYDQPKPPRNITTLPKAHNLPLGGYARAMKDGVLSLHLWFGVGLTPAVTAERLVNLSCGAATLIESDYTRFDGHISGFLKSVPDGCMLLWAEPSHQGAVRNLLGEEEDPEARTRMGLRYHPKSSRLSGSSITSDHNTLINAFVMYAALRVAGHSQIAARSQLESRILVHGDDGLAAMPADFSDHINTVCKAVGLAIKVVVKDANDPVLFLGRAWPSLTHASTDSLADPLRVISNIHLSIAPLASVPRLDAALNKACAWLVTDSMTPVVCSWCNAVKAVAASFSAGPKPPATMTRDELYRVENGAYPQTNPYLIRSTFCTLAGVLETDVALAEDQYREFNRRLQNGDFATADEALDNFPNAPLSLAPRDLPDEDLFFLDGEGFRLHYKSIKQGRAVENKSSFQKGVAPSNDKREGQSTNAKQPDKARATASSARSTKRAEASERKRSHSSGRDLPAPDGDSPRDKRGDNPGKRSGSKGNVHAGSKPRERRQPKDKLRPGDRSRSTGPHVQPDSVPRPTQD